MPAKDPRLYLIHIRECCERILDYTGGIESTWPDVPEVRDAVCSNLQTIDDAARRFHDALRTPHAKIPWRALTDVRNILIHAFGRVAGEILVDIVRQDIPPLLASVRRILGEGKD